MGGLIRRIDACISWFSDEFWSGDPHLLLVLPQYIIMLLCTDQEQKHPPTAALPLLVLLLMFKHHQKEKSKKWIQPQEVNRTVQVGGATANKEQISRVD